MADIHRLIPTVFRYASAVVVGMGCFGGSTLAQQLAFSDSDSSQVEYWLTPHESLTACAELLSLSGFEFTLSTATERTIDDTSATFCQVNGIIQPEIQFQVNLPSNWNGRFYMHGNGGTGGVSADHPRRWSVSVNALKQGFAVAYSNSGHDIDLEPGITFAIDNPGKEIDFAFRATQLTAIAAKRISTAFYHRQSDYDYFDGCSWGGHQGFAMAQRFPNLFDGILAGAPVFNFTGVQFGHAQLVRTLHPDHWPSKEDAKVLANAILAKCDNLDGLSDGVVQNPRMCEFDPRVDVPACNSSDQASHCISPEKREKLASIYAPVIVGGKTLSPGHPVSGEIDGYLMGAPGRPGRIDNQMTARTPDGEPFIFFRFEEAVQGMFFRQDDLERSWQDFDLDRDWQAAMTQAGHFNDTNPDLGPLRASGGKFLVYHGWADFNINPNITYEYFEEVHRVMGTAAANETARLFMVPGMYHCRGGQDVFQFDGMTPLINWVERDEAPDQIVFSGNADFHPDRERPICAFPRTAAYRGGDPDRPESFECAE